MIFTRHDEPKVRFNVEPLFAETAVVQLFDELKLYWHLLNG